VRDLGSPAEDLLRARRGAEEEPARIRPADPAGLLEPPERRRHGGAVRTCEMADQLADMGSVLPDLSER